MVIIAHRGLLEGPNTQIENSPNQIDESISLGFDVEIDLHYFNDEYWLGHDNPQYKVSLDWLEKRKNWLWIHCKTLKSLTKMNETDFNYFWHENDTVTLTSKGYIWAYPGKQPIANSIAVLPELYDDDVQNSFGVCTDFPKWYFLTEL
jgi:hypothetical protein